MLSSHEEHHRRARAVQNLPETKALLSMRVVVEHRFARLMQLGGRKMNAFGIANARVQSMMTAAVANFTLALGKTLGNGVGDTFGRTSADRLRDLLQRFRIALTAKLERFLAVDGQQRARRAGCWPSL